MLDLRATIEGDRVVINGLNKTAAGMPHAIDRGLIRIAKGTHREVYAFLSGPGSKASRQKGVKGSQAGSYPVPVVTGHLRAHSDWLRPNESKQTAVGAFKAGEHEVVLYDSAEYARPIHEGTGSSAKFGARRFLNDGFERFNQGNRAVKIMGEEVQAEIDKNLK